MLICALAAAATMGLYEDSKQPIRAVSMFKNGFAFIARQTPIPKGGEYVVDEPTFAAHGTYWHIPSSGVSISRATTATIDLPVAYTVPNLDQLLDLNKGSQITIDFHDIPTATGEFLGSFGEHLMLRTSEGTVLVSRSRIKRVIFQKDPKTQGSTKTSKRVLKLNVEARNPGTVTTVGLERGLAWVPAYAVDISDEKELRLIAKATIVNELADLENVEASFITGFPNVKFSNVWDPLTNPNGLDAILGSLVSGSFTEAPNANVLSQSARSRVAEDADFGQMMPTPGVGQQHEDLFFYRIPNVSLKKGERAAYTLMNLKAPYRHIFTWQVVRSPLITNPYEDRIIQERQTQDVWHALAFKNTTGQPLTTAAATTMQNGQLLGQDMLKYTSPGAEAELRITKAMDIMVDATEQEISRERAALRLPNSSTTYDLITVRGTLKVENGRSSASSMKVTTAFEGDLVSVDGEAKGFKEARGLASLNPFTRLDWRPVVGSGNKATLNYTYKIYIRTP